MSTQHPEELLSAYLDGELSPAEKADVERRLQESSELRELLAEMKEVSLQVRMLPRPYAPPEMRTEVLHQIDQRRISPRASRSGGSAGLGRIARWSAVAVAACLLVVVSISLNLPKDVQHQQQFKESLAVNTEAVPEAMPSPVTSLNESSADMAPQFSREGDDAFPPVPVVSLSKEEIRRRIQDLNRMPVVGNTINVPGSIQDDDGETPIVIEFTVVDVMKAMNQVQVLVEQQQVRSGDNRVLSANLQQFGVPKLTAVGLELEMDGPEMAHVLNNVAAFDAVMYVEDGVNLNQTDHSLAETQARSTVSRTVQPNETSDQFGSPAKREDKSDRQQQQQQQRQFNFQQLADQSVIDNSGSPRRAGMPVAKSLPAEQSGAAARASKSTKMADALAAPAPPLPVGQSAPALQNARAKQGFSAKAAESQTPQEPGANWEDAPRFRAFILLKPQSPASTSPNN
ncbi:anti-sigma factor family protein [Planctomicrobium sp. SH661]|uniref:anti-sigma factor family protein n=1 Tax=Planctomicrobium sp. SH661 TaxID=3448124 RepID=UPI003F5BDA7D